MSCLSESLVVSSSLKRDFLCRGSHSLQEVLRLEVEPVMLISMAGSPRCLTSQLLPEARGKGLIRPDACRPSMPG